MKKVKALEIPKSHVDFANAVANIADIHGIKDFTIEYNPEFDIGLNGPENFIRGNMKIHYSTTDGRGRPHKQLKISCESFVNVDVIDQ